MKREPRNPRRSGRIKRGVMGHKHGSPERITIFKQSGGLRLLEQFGLEGRPADAVLPWRVVVGPQAEIDPNDSGNTYKARTFPQALRLADGVITRAETYQRTQRLMPSRLRPRPRIDPMQVVLDETRHWARAGANHV